ncbi:MAG: hypothetical protein A2817_01750 [Candidatus Yanofskybacteria bacterium RIFCSPHIGHO2_01_FULL_39_8b]|uniref:Uncharacterized protein n=1 Tax=Candidatus Yanofskybacteria bacterium RIFCSPHIGHO2_01_FULL_39_8b TaxID=1802659 RepID=A0A1F8ED90_9BACT|nr:MAG: hypothetical protein A2817_01750 [Candidatus Yanofskybacteria bacterium RIFCSPHIGHO2_01_FULL_39_8b]
MNDELPHTPVKKGMLYWFDNLIKKFIPNFNYRAILYFSVIFAVAVYIHVWRIAPAPPAPKPPDQKHETVIADESYWDSQPYKDKIKNQTVDSFVSELSNWLNGKDKELVKRKFEDLVFINYGLTQDTGGDLTTVVPESFAYLENNVKARYQYAKDKDFLADTPTLVKIGAIICNINETTEQVTGVELYDWRYASMPKLAAFMKTKPDWKVTVGDRILDVSDPRIEDKDLLKYRNAQTQPVGLFSFLIFHNPKTNRITLADTRILDLNGIDAKLTLARISARWNKQPKLYFVAGFEGCKSLTSSTTSPIPYGQSD